METGWIQVFILTLAQCVAPEGKMVCQQERVEFQFASEEDCRGALMQMLDYAARTDNVIVDRQRSSCRVAVREARVFASGDDARAALGDADDVVLIEGEAARLHPGGPPRTPRAPAPMRGNGRHGTVQDR